VVTPEKKDLNIKADAANFLVILFPREKLITFLFIPYKDKKNSKLSHLDDW
jgi:hypothetical protein